MFETESNNHLDLAAPEETAKEKIKRFVFCLENLEFESLYIEIEKNSDNGYSISIGE